MECNTIRQIRLAKEITKESIAETLGIHVNTYTLWEENPGKIPAGRVYDVCDALGVEYDKKFFCH